jgi:hypothetical protein
VTNLLMYSILRFGIIFMLIFAANTDVLPIVYFTKEDLRACGHSSEAGHPLCCATHGYFSRFTAVPICPEVFFRETDYTYMV